MSLSVLASHLWLCCFRRFDETCWLAFPPGIASPLAAFCAAELQRKDAVWTGNTSFDSSVPTTPAVFELLSFEFSVFRLLTKRKCCLSPELRNKSAYFLYAKIWTEKKARCGPVRCGRSVVVSGPLWSVRCGPGHCVRSVGVGPLCSVRCVPSVVVGPLCSVRCGRSVVV